jgi:hypothetical protein
MFRNPLTKRVDCMKEYKNKDKNHECEWRTMYSQMQSKLKILSTRGWFLQEWFKQDRVSLWGKAKEAIIVTNFASVAAPRSLLLANSAGRIFNVRRLCQFLHTGPRI